VSRTPARRALFALVVQLRDRHDLPLWQDVAERLGISPRYLSQIRHHRTGLTLDRVHEWCSAEGLTLVVRPDGSASVVEEVDNRGTDRE